MRFAVLGTAAVIMAVVFGALLPLPSPATAEDCRFLPSGKTMCNYFVEDDCAPLRVHFVSNADGSVSVGNHYNCPEDVFNYRLEAEAGEDLGFEVLTISGRGNTLANGR